MWQFACPPRKALSYIDPLTRGMGPPFPIGLNPLAFQETYIPSAFSSLKELSMNLFLPVAAGIHLRRAALAAATGGLLALGSGAALAVDTTFAGSTNGCFGLACTPTPSATLAGLTYTNSTFSVTSAGGFAAIGSAPGTPNSDNLGSFTLTGAPFTYAGSVFDLMVSFTAPPGTTPGSVTVAGTLSGMVTSTDNGGIFINFDSTPHHFTFGSGATAGSFDFFVNPVSMTAGNTVAVSGTITTQTAAVPEPETYALFLAGLAAVGFMARRRKS
jgi:hypothetical protein